MVRHYETVFIMTPVLSDEQMKEAVSKFQNYLTAKGSEIVYEDYWGLRKLAYPIQKKSTGFFHIITYTADPVLIKEFETELKRDERVIRFLTVHLDKYALAYSKKRIGEKEAAKLKEQ